MCVIDILVIYTVLSSIEVPRNLTNRAQLNLGMDEG